MAPLEITYHLQASSDEAATLAESVLLEQTIETPRVVAERNAFVRDHMMGSIREIVPTEDGAFRAVLSLPVIAASVDVAQFINVLFGNSSLHAHVRLDDFHLPPSLQQLFDGPAFGIDGVRQRTGVRNRPLTAAALKPVGLHLDEITELCRTLAEGGVDLIKDDHYLADHAFCPFEDRVRGCQAAVEEVAVRTGHRALYVPNLSGTPDQVWRQVDVAQEIGVGAVMAAPMLLGLPFFYELTHGRVDVPVLAHPSFAGATRIRPDTLFGKLFRLFGADAVIFANYGGRFSYSQEDCGRIARALRADELPYRTALPVPAGGMQVERTLELVEFFGLDTMLLIGGSLLKAGDALLDRTRAFTDSVQRAAVTLDTG